MNQRRNTKQRQIVLAAVAARCDHPTVAEIYQDTKARHSQISQATVYRNLQLLSESGDIQKLKSPQCERFDRRTDRHHHFICQNCGKVLDLELPYDSTLDEKAATVAGCPVRQHRLVFEGLCPTCAKH